MVLPLKTAGWMRVVITFDTHLHTFNTSVTCASATASWIKAPARQPARTEGVFGLLLPTLSFAAAAKTRDHSRRELGGDATCDQRLQAAVIGGSGSGARESVSGAHGRATGKLWSHSSNSH
jgi:hypothetical protein